MTGIAVLVGAAICLGACGANRETGPAHSAEQGVSHVGHRESLRGRVAIVGSAPWLQTVIRPEGGGADIVVESPVADSLRSVDGFFVIVQGRRDSLAFVVESFTALSVDGSPVHDGTLMKTSTGYALHTRGDVVVELPGSVVGLEPYVGRRIWIVSGPDAGGGRFGRIH